MNALHTARRAIAELSDVMQQTNQARQQAQARCTSATQEVAGHTLAEVFDLAKRKGLTEWPLRAGRQRGLWVHVYPAQGAA